MNNFFQFAIILFILIFSLFSVFQIKPCDANKNLYVRFDKDDSFLRISSAIENASKNDTIFVSNGTYFENIVINKSLNLIGESNSTTVLDGHNGLYNIFIDSNNVNISNFYFKNSTVGVYINGADSQNIKIDSCTFSNLSDGIYIYKSSNNNISNNEFLDLSSKAIILWNSSNNEIFKNFICKNYYGIKFGKFSQNNLILLNNFSFNNNAIIIEYSNFNYIKNNSIFENSQGIQLFNSLNNTIIGNLITKTDVYGIYLDNYLSNKIIDNTFKNNYVDIKEKSTPPKIKAPGFEFLIMILSLILVFIFIKKRK
jgi:parallel beta-helix repeat protein